ncbi:hypothetical protein HA399_17430 (plasmid) [Cobetia sp. UIB-001]|uniref:hypothetical protein n=1 Tax=Cobetia sp. UIB-001 TaxID=2717697 RepID=UPI00384FDCD8
MPLSKIKMKVNYSLRLVERSIQEHRFESMVWYNTQGYLNAFYAIREELFKVIKDDKKNIRLTNAIKLWQEKGDNLDRFFGNARNLVTHRGQIEVHSYQRWTIDHINDTEHPTMEYSISIRGIDEFTDMPYDHFLHLCIAAFSHLNIVAQSIEEIYYKLED